MPLSYTDTYDIDEDVGSHGLTVGGKLLDAEKLKFWQGFHDRRKAALKAVNTRDDFTMLRLFIAECETLGMPASARACMAIMRGVIG